MVVQALHQLFGRVNVERALDDRHVDHGRQHGFQARRARCLDQRVVKIPVGGLHLANAIVAGGNAGLHALVAGFQLIGQPLPTARGRKEGGVWLQQHAQLEGFFHIPVAPLRHADALARAVRR